MKIRVCLKPFITKDKQGRPIEAPCGQCPTCKTKRVKEWGFRLMQEHKVHHNAYFVTMTYDNDNVPITESSFLTLYKNDLVLFHRALRDRIKAYNKKYNTNYNFKYYAVGEYGEKGRPHYHAIYFDVPILNDILELWDKGDVKIDQCNEASCMYVAKYIDKENKIGLEEWDDRTIKFSMMSKGIGSSFLNKTVKKQLYNNTDIVTYFNGAKMSIPRYYRKKLFSDVKNEVHRDVLKAEYSHRLATKAKRVAEETLQVLRREHKEYYPNDEITFEKWLASKHTGIKESFINNSNRYLC